jgi:hypothetical protein
MTALKNIPALIGGATILAAAIGLTAASASAEKVWDIGAYDNCTKKAGDRYAGGVTSDAQYAEEMKWCCVSTGGELSSTQGCVAPLATAPQTGNGTLPTAATNAPNSPAPGSRAPGGVPRGSVSP